jgi:hypothetical protein
MVMDYSPELGGDSAAGLAYEAYMGHFTAVRPEGYQITHLSTDKSVGGEDEVYVINPDGTTGGKTRQRGKDWPRSWAGQIMWARWRDFPGSSLEGLGSVAEAVSGRNLPYIVCRARWERHPARKQIEIVRLSKMDRHFRDVGGRYILPFVATIFDFVGGMIGRSFSGIPAALATTLTSTMTNTVKYAASGRLDSWRDGVRILRRSVDWKVLAKFSDQVSSSSSSEVVNAIGRAVKEVKNASYVTQAIASMAGVEMGALLERNKRAARGGSPSVIVRAFIYT